MSIPVRAPGAIRPIERHLWASPADREQSTTPTVGFKVREIIGINFAFGSNAMTDEPLWIRVDEPGTI